MYKVTVNCMKFPFILESLKLPDDVNMLEDPDFM